MGWLIKFVLGKVSGPVLIYVLLGLVAANATTGYLLKKAWDKNATAVLECENQALRDANNANAAITVELKRLQRKHEAYRESVRRLTEEADKEIQRRRREMEAAHESEIAALEVATNEIPDDDFFCASEPVSSGLLTGCASQSPPITKTELVTVTEEVPLRVSRDRLQNCDRLPMPPFEAEWLELPGMYIKAVQVLDICNMKISAFWTWHDAQFPDAPE